MSTSGGYLDNPDARSDCLYCSARTADAWLYSTFNIQYVHRWRNAGLFCTFIVFNVSWCLFFLFLLALVWLFINSFRADGTMCRSVPYMGSHTFSVSRHIRRAKPLLRTPCTEVARKCVERRSIDERSRSRRTMGYMQSKSCFRFRKKV